MNAATKPSPQLDAIISAIAEKLKPVVNEIHEGQATTKNYYGDYMAILSQCGNDKGKIKLVALALIKAGANVYGVDSAVSILS